MVKYKKDKIKKRDVKKTLVMSFYTVVMYTWKQSRKKIILKNYIKERFMLHSLMKKVNWLHYFEKNYHIKMKNYQVF